jgi:2-oxoglutarate decarboxylase
MDPVLEGTLVSVTLPEMGESVTEGSIVEWRRHVGDFVAEGDPLVEVTTDKVDVEVPATVSGVVTQIAVREGETVSVGAVLAQIDTSQTNGAAARQPSAGNGAPVAKPAPPPSVPAAAAGEALADQPARRMARQLDVDLKLVRGSGPNGLILRSDVVEQAAQAHRRPAAAVSPLPALPPGTKTTPLRGPAAALTGYMEQSL